MGDDLPVGTTPARGLPPPEAIHWPLLAARELFELRYGKALVADQRRPGAIPVYGTNGRCGSHDQALFRGPGVVLGRKGQGPLGVEWCNEDFWVIDTGYALIPLRPDIDLRYAYFLVKFVGLNHLKDGTSNPTLSRDSFGAQALPLPPMKDQQAIAQILGALDDKIDLNRRMSETLEAMALALFKSWFVDFDPMRAKAEGRDPEVPLHIAGLFPEVLQDSDVGPFPAGWSRMGLGDAFAITMGQSPPGETYNEVGEGLPFYQGRADFGPRFPERRVYCTSPTRLASRHDTLVTVRAPVGDINVALEPCAIGRGVAAVRHRSGSRSFTFYSMASREHEFATFEADGTVFGSIGRKDFEAMAWVEPPAEVIAAFERTCGPWDDAIERNAVESHTLAALRDTLLPKLISGEVRIPDAERIVGEVA